jgi:hypothetical protein
MSSSEMAAAWRCMHVVLTVSQRLLTKSHFCFICGARDARSNEQF